MNSPECPACGLAQPLEAPRCARCGALLDGPTPDGAGFGGGADRLSVGGFAGHLDDRTILQAKPSAVAAFSWHEPGPLPVRGARPNRAKFDGPARWLDAWRNLTARFGRRTRDRNPTGDWAQWGAPPDQPHE